MSKPFLAIAIWLSFIPVADAQNNWISIRNGLEILQGSFADRGETIEFVIIRTDPKRNRIRVIDTYRQLGNAGAYTAS